MAQTSYHKFRQPLPQGPPRKKLPTNECKNLQILLAREHGNGWVFQNGALQFPSFSRLFGARLRCVSVSQVRALEAVYLGKDILEVLPTGYGKSLIFQLIPNFIAFKKHMLCCTSGTVDKEVGQLFRYGFQLCKRR